jgi:hypothetical protein
MLSLTWNWQSRLLSIDWPFSSTPCLSLAFDTYPRHSVLLTHILTLLAKLRVRRHSFSRQRFTDSQRSRRFPTFQLKIGPHLTQFTIFMAQRSWCAAWYSTT